jgi:hypothetical protein
MKRIDAFPVSRETGYGDRGMSLRDYLAGQALASMFGAIMSASSATLKALMETAAERGDGKSLSPTLARMSYEAADAMLAEREKEQS